MLGTFESVGVQCQGPVPAGWLTHVYLIACVNVAFDIYPGAALRPQNALWLTSEKLVTEIRLRAKTASFTEALANTPQGETYNPLITIPIPTLANDLTDWAYRNAQRRFVAIFRDTAGNCYLAGTKSNGLRLGWGRSVQNMSSQQLTISGMNWHPALWLSTVNPDELFPSRKEFDYSFDLSFS